MTGLRARKRAALERELANTAYTLVRERGFTAVTVEDIVQAAGVSRRTFSNYFACKEEAVAAVMIQRTGDALTSWSPPPSRTGLIPTIRALLAHQFSAGTFTIMASTAELAREHHQLLPYLRDAQWQLWSTAGTRIVEELREADPIRRSELTAVIGAVFAVVTNALNPTGGGAHHDAAPPLPDILEHILGRLETGFGTPPS